ALKPKVVMMENVPGMFKDARLKSVLRSLRAQGYRCKTAILDAAHYGVPQRRRRFILLATRIGQISFAPTAKRLRSVRETIAHVDQLAHMDALHKVGEKRSS